MDKSEELRRIIEDCVEDELRHAPLASPHDLAYRIAREVRCCVRGVGIKAVPASPTWPQVDR